MDQQTIIAGFEARARALGLPMSQVCDAAGVHPTTFSRWKRSERNPKPVGASLKSLSAIEDALVQQEGPRPTKPASAAAA